MAWNRLERPPLSPLCAISREPVEPPLPPSLDSSPGWRVYPDAVVAGAFASLGEGVLVADAGRIFLSANPAFQRITGYGMQEKAGQPCAFLQGPETSPETIARIRTALTAGQPFSGEVLNYRKDGSCFWNDLTINPVRDAKGALTHFIGVVRDITAHKEIRQRLEAAEQRYRDLIDHVLSAIIVHGPNAEVLLINATASALLGATLEDLQPKTDRGEETGRWRFFRPDGSVVERADYPVYQVLKTGQAVGSQVIGFDRADGARVWVMSNAYPLTDATGNMAEVVTCFTDVTGLIETERALMQSEERLQLVLQGSRDASWDWDLVTGALYRSPRWWQMLGYEVDELTGDRDFWTRVVHPDDSEWLEQQTAAIVGGDGTAYEFEFRLRHKAGHYIPVLSRGFVLRDNTGKAVRISGTNTDISERKETEARIHQLAYFDALTDLPNRWLLLETLRRALRTAAETGGVGALLVIDLDNFKTLNDTLGHEVGDDLLIQAGQRLRAVIGGTDMVARVGGDEFVVVAEGLPADAPEAAVERLGLCILDSLNQPYWLSGRYYHNTPSIGAVLFDAEAEGADTVMRQADLAMYQAKAEGRNTLRFFDPSLQAAVDQRVALEADLREGLQRDELVLYCQKQVDERGGLTGAEILVRWLHPVRGLVPPGLCIPLAEACGLILPLGQWVLQRACERLAAWADDPALRDIALSVNVSAHQVREARFVDNVRAVLDSTGANPRRLKLELTESLMAENIEDTIAKMTQLKACGVSFSLDDFGTGYSSLSYLKRFPFEQLKIDQAFVRDVLTDPNAAAIAEIIITLADKLGLGVVAEGVETDAERQFLIDKGCFQFQGYLFGRPMPIDAFEKECRNRPNGAVR